MVTYISGTSLSAVTKGWWRNLLAWPGGGWITQLHSLRPWQLRLLPSSVSDPTWTARKLRLSVFANLWSRAE